MSELSTIDEFIHSRASQASISCKSSIVTVFGDVVSQHGGWIWLGSLIESLAPLGFSERLIRTSVFRLVKEDWLQVNKVGRRSFYGFTPSATKHFTKAARRIYAKTIPQSDGEWLIVMPTFVQEDKMVLLRRQLQWLGFSTLSSGAFAHPSLEHNSLLETINELELNDETIIFTSKTLNESSAKVLSKLVFSKWNVKALQQNYQDLIECYQPWFEKLDTHRGFSDQQSYLLRLLLIHEYRRILLKDHELPPDMLPSDWKGYSATGLVNQFYSRLVAASNRYIVNQLQNQNGHLDKASADFYKRFN